jgi:hypothetical protein
MKIRILTLLLLLGAGGPAAAQQAEGHETMSADEIAQELSNPVSSIWSFQLQNNMTFGRGDGRSYRGKWTTNFQPVMPLKLTDDWNLILRPVFNYTNTLERRKDGFDVSSEDVTRESLSRTSGIGQTSVVTFLSPTKSKLLWGVGPSFIFPTTTRDALSQRKYAIGPAAVVLRRTKDWVVGIFPQYWWSFSGSNKRREMSQANIQYFLWRSLGDGWQVGASPNITYNRKSSGADAWQVPLGLGVQKVVLLGKLPVRFGFETQYYVKHSDSFGPRWNLRFSVTPVLPALVKEKLF